ncbi:MAG: NAD-dependent epimerase/dehydratase family protein [Anaerolineae bacterium]|nr:NAD-dependent epimerase/dehydratase family protein [Anaerolineae bacterium]
MKSIIFGINGQDGYYLRRTFENNNIDVIGVSRSSGDNIQGNVADNTFVNDLIQANRPDYILHLAANSSTKHEVIFENHETISTGTLNILEAVKRHQPDCKVFITGSGVQFENHGLPLKETDTFMANSPYAVARIQSVYAARYYRSLGIPIYVGYLFHHESPFRTTSHISKLIAEAVKRIERGSSEKILIGDLTVKKEWGFAGDIAEGIFTLLNQDHIYEATIGTGKAYSIEDWVRTCFELIGKNWEDYVEENPQFEKVGPKLLVSDPATINLLGWQAKLELGNLAKLMIAEK